ncbi:hypothetical protein [Candidatus Cytomitobacter primus]|uniref:Uncharacterized protein n=1 Tax=Candidatus Cytomitobacter primus TaxID=2066024 RepID=A0A5C0UET8_9PROT|nr:hypothetical protein [Candidatus Cytomitobacter primus]QEK38568.1 hypothetical protein FZC34_01425 [Candidatus Cytomitobacter primus]
MQFSKKLIILLSHFPFFKKNTEDRNIARVIADVVHDKNCYKSKSNLNKCILDLITTKKYEINRLAQSAKTDTVKRFIYKYNANKRNLEKSNMIGEVYPKHRKYDKAILLYDEDQNIEVFRAKLIFLETLHSKGYSWDKIDIIVSSKMKNYSFETLSILNNKSKKLPINTNIKIDKSSYKPSNDLEIVKYILEQMKISPALSKQINFYVKQESINQLMENWIEDNYNTKAIDIQINPTIPYYKSKWNTYSNYDANKIEVIGGEGVTDSESPIRLYKNAELILSNIGMYYSNLYKYHF